MGVKLGKDLHMKPTKKEKNKKNNLKKSMEEYWMNSHLSGGHLSYLDNLYENYIKNS